MRKKKLKKRIEFLEKNLTDLYKLVGRLTDGVLVQQIRIEVLNKDMLNFIPDKDRKGNQIIQ